MEALCAKNVSHDVEGSNQASRMKMNVDNRCNFFAMFQINDQFATGRNQSMGKPLISIKANAVHIALILGLDWIRSEKKSRKWDCLGLKLGHGGKGWWEIIE